MSVTDELRKFADDRTFLGNDYMELYAIADRIDVEYQKAIRELNNLADACILLPRDADGEPIHVGDEVKDVDYDGHANVSEMHIATDGWWICAGGVCRRPDSYRHYHTPTVEDILREFTDTILEWSGKSGTIAEVGTWSDIAAEYAAKLQLKED